METSGLNSIQQCSDFLSSWCVVFQWPTLFVFIKGKHFYFRKYFCTVPWLAVDQIWNFSRNIFFILLKKKNRYEFYSCVLNSDAFITETKLMERNSQGNSVLIQNKDDLNFSLKPSHNRAVEIWITWNLTKALASFVCRFTKFYLLLPPFSKEVEYFEYIFVFGSRNDLSLREIITTCASLVLLGLTGSRSSFMCRPIDGGPV